MPAVTTWIAVPLLGGVIGYVTNRIAVKMIFRPIRPVSVLGLRVQGLIGHRQHELAESIGVDTTDFGGQLFEYAASSSIGSLLDFALDNVGNNLGVVEGVGGALFTGTPLDVGVGDLTLITPAGIAGFVGGYIGRQIVQAFLRSLWSR